MPRKERKQKGQKKINADFRNLDASRLFRYHGGGSAGGKEKTVAPNVSDRFGIYGNVLSVKPTMSLRFMKTAGLR